jgi:c-di-GMP-binding flagellar brake protein YcgR
VTSDFQERRKSPRVAVRGQYEFHAARRVRIRLLDISASGALLASDERLPVGGTGRLRLLLGEAPFDATVEVTREEPSPQGRGRLVGVSIVSVQSAQQEALEDFLRRAGS